jgi:hypothetical protein
MTYKIKTDYEGNRRGDEDYHPGPQPFVEIKDQRAAFKQSVGLANSSSVRMMLGRLPTSEEIRERIDRANKLPLL